MAASADVDPESSVALVLAAIGSLLLVTSGYVKLRRPVALARVLYAAELPSSFRLVRILGGTECAVGLFGIAAVIRPETAIHRAGFLGIAVIYVLFASFLVWAQVGNRQLGSCGCVGGVDVPPSWAHVIGNLVLALAAGLCFARGRTLDTLAIEPSLRSALALSLIPLASYLGYLALVRTSGATNLRPRP